VLGPVRLDVDGSELPLSGRRQRAVLARLVLGAGQAVSADELLNDVWADGLPATGVKTVAYQISKLRSLLGSHAGVIATTTTGYRLDLARDRVDVHVADELIDQAREVLGSDPHRSEALIERALRLRRGRAFADVDEIFVDIEVQRLEGRHLLARHTLAEARLAQGRAADVIGDLGALLAENPLEEGVAGSLMIALERSGRTADALRVFADLRRRLGAELGIEPSGQLRQLEQRLLLGDGAPEPTAPRASNLPTPVSSFVGRADEITQIVDLLAGVRLVTLTSFGGAGKTRLAIEVAARLEDRFPDGLWFIDLVPISDPVLLAETFLDNIGTVVSGAQDAPARLRAELAGRRALIVVDNCEHVADDVGRLIGALLRDAPDLCVLATSRVSLGVPGEVVWNVPPLPAATAGVELFGQRAEHIRPGSVAQADHSVIVEICERMDGIPLAIELASARLRTMTVEQIAEHLADRFRLLVNTERRADERQQSLLATLSWSYDLLDAPERALLSQLASCVDGFTLDAAVVLSDGDRLDVLGRLDRLVGAGLVAFSEHAGVGRYRMLETVREFAADRLEPQDRTDANHRHAAYYATVAAAVAELIAAGDDEGIRLADRELGNLRAAMGWAYAHGQARVGMGMAHHLWRYFYDQPTGSNENIRWGLLALDSIEDDDEDTMLVAADTVIEAYNLGDRDAVEAGVDRIQRGLDEVRTPHVRSRLLTALNTAVLDTDPRAAEAYLNAAWSTAPPRPEAIPILSNLIELSWHSGVLDVPEMIRRLDAVLATMDERPPLVLKVRAGIAASAGQWDEVVRLTDDLPGTKLDNDLQVVRIEALIALGRFAEALTLTGAPDPFDYWFDVQRVRYLGAVLELARRDAPAALERLRPAVRWTQMDARPLALAMHLAALLAVTMHRLGHDDDAARLFGFAAAERERLRIELRLSYRSLVDEAEAACRSVVGASRCDELAAAGAATPWPRLVDEVLGSPSEPRTAK
jgi:predicted ATPase/DNA-binding SARP family transcriptional activator